MMRRPIGYYVHHHGAGHRARADAIAAVIDWPMVLLGTGIGGAGIDLCDDRTADSGFDGLDNVRNRPQALHYAPIDHEGVRRRVAEVTQWIADARPALMVVDVSAEIAMLARLASVPTLTVRLNGERNDPAHLDAFRGAEALLAPFHPALEHPETPDWVREKTRHFPGITAARYDACSSANQVLVVIGRGGPPGDGTQLARAAMACPELQWRVIGPVTPTVDIPHNLEFAGWVSNAGEEIAQAGVVVGAAGDGLVGAVLAADRPFVCIPQDRPYGEQHATAQQLARAGAAIVIAQWPAPDSWPLLIGQARALPSAARTALHDPMGAHAAASWIAGLAAAATTPFLEPAT